jgi:hypothetical protein
MPSWLSFYSSNLLLSLQGVQQPCEDPSVDSSFKPHNSKEFSSLLCLSAHCLNAHLAECLLPELQQFCLLLCTYALAQCPPGRALRILSDSGSSPNSQQSPSSVHPLHLLNAHLAKLYRNHERDFVCNCVSHTHPFLQGIQQP